MKKEHCLLCYIASKYHQAFAIMYISLNFQEKVQTLSELFLPVGLPEGI